MNWRKRHKPARQMHDERWAYSRKHIFHLERLSARTNTHAHPHTHQCQSCETSASCHDAATDFKRFLLSVFFCFRYFAPLLAMKVERTCSHTHTTHPPAIPKWRPKWAAEYWKWTQFLIVKVFLFFRSPKNAKDSRPPPGSPMAPAFKRMIIII